MEKLTQEQLLKIITQLRIFTQPIFVEKLDSFLLPTGNHSASLLIYKVTVTISKWSSLVFQVTGINIISQIFFSYYLLL